MFAIGVAIVRAGEHAVLDVDHEQGVVRPVGQRRHGVLLVPRVGGHTLRDHERALVVVCTAPGVGAGGELALFHQLSRLGEAHLREGRGGWFAKILLHLIDVSDASGRPDPTEDFKVIMNELESWGTGLEHKPMIVVASKIDTANPDKLAKLKRFSSRRKLPFMAISAVTGEGIEKLKYAVGERVKEIRATPDASSSETQSLPA